MALTVAEVKWLLNILQDSHIQLPTKPTLLCDNTSATFMARNPISQKRSWHININIHFVCELVSNGTLQIQHVSSTLQTADILTKSLSVSLFKIFRSKLYVFPTTLSLRGGVSSNNSPSAEIEKIKEANHIREDQGNEDHAITINGVTS